MKIYTQQFPDFTQAIVGFYNLKSWSASRLQEIKPVSNETRL